MPTTRCTSLAEYTAALEVDEAAQTAFDAALDAYRHGVGTYTDVVHGQTALAEAQSEKEDAHANVFTRPRRWRSQPARSWKSHDRSGARKIVPGAPSHFKSGHARTATLTGLQAIGACAYRPSSPDHPASNGALIRANPHAAQRG